MFFLGAMPVNTPTASSCPYCQGDVLLGRWAGAARMGKGRDYTGAYVDGHGGLS